MTITDDQPAKAPRNTKDAAATHIQEVRRRMDALDKLAAAAATAAQAGEKVEAAVRAAQAAGATENELAAAGQMSRLKVRRILGRRYAYAKPKTRTVD